MFKEFESFIKKDTFIKIKKVWFFLLLLSTFIMLYSPDIKMNYGIDVVFLKPGLLVLIVASLIYLMFELGLIFFANQEAKDKDKISTTDNNLYILMSGFMLFSLLM